MRPRHRRQGARTAIVSAAVALCACTGPGNTGIETPDPNLILEVPWTNGILPVVSDAGPNEVVLPQAPEYPPIASGMADPGSNPPNCSLLQGIETSAPYWYDDFEPYNNPATQYSSGNFGVAFAWAGYDDLSQYSFHAPGDLTWYPGLANGFTSPLQACMSAERTPDQPCAPWGLGAYPIQGPSCDGKPNNWAMRFVGGLFRNWGGGVSHVFTDRWFPQGLSPTSGPPYDNTGNCPAGADFCAPPTLAVAKDDSSGIPNAAPDGGAYANSHAYVDASQWDGVAFWARRGPESQDRLIVTVTDNFTSDRLARQNQKYCRRARQCYSTCLSGVPCQIDPSSTTMNPDGGPPLPVYRCFDPASGIMPGALPLGGGAVGAPDSLVDLLYPRCGPSACTYPDSYPDPDFQGKQCQPYEFPGDEWYIAGEFCFNPGDLPPPDRDFRCLDGWATTVQLTTDWQYYTVPFSQMQQGGFGKVAPYFNLRAVDTVALGVVVGWADIYVDDISFYRQTN
jgi:hypothetical protein